MTCPICGSDTRVIDTRKTMESVVRQRKCKSCGHGFHTVELESQDAKYVLNDIHYEFNKGR